MSDMIKVAVDAMGGDHAPAAIVKGAVDAVKRAVLSSMHLQTDL